MFTAAETVAICKAIKDKEFNAAKEELVEGSVTPVDLKIRISGVAQKNHGIPGGSSERPPEISFMTPDAICALMRQLGIGQKRLREALEELKDPRKCSMDADLLGVFNDVAEKTAKRLPKVIVNSPGRAGSCTAAVSITRI